MKSCIVFNYYINGQGRNCRIVAFIINETPSLSYVNVYSLTCS